MNAENNLPIVRSEPPTKLIAQIFKESWLTILITMITLAFSIGVAYAQMSTSIDVNSKRIDAIELSRSQSRQEMLSTVNSNKQEVIDRIDKLEKKLDDIDRYLREHKQ